MRQFYKQGYTKFPFTKIVVETDKAILFKIKNNVEIWIPKTWIVRMGKKSFTVKDHIATDIKLKIKAESDASN